MRRFRPCSVRWLLLVVLSLLGNAASLAAQDAGSTDSLRLSLDEAVARALQASEEIAVTRAQVDQAASRVTQATAPALPQLSAGLTYNRAIKTIFDDIDFGTADSGDDSSSESFSDLPFGRPVI